MTTATNTTIEKYLKGPYSRVLIPDVESGTYAAEIPEFPGCVSQGNTPEEAYARLEEAARSWLQASLEAGLSIPAPFASAGYSGRIALRLPRGLHRQAAYFADREGVSINQLLISAVAEKVGALNLYDRLITDLLYAHRLLQSTAILPPMPRENGP